MNYDSCEDLSYSLKRLFTVCRSFQRGQHTTHSFRGFCGCYKNCLGWSRYSLTASQLKWPMLPVYKYAMYPQPKWLCLTTTVIPDLPGMQQRWAHPLRKIYPYIHLPGHLSPVWQEQEVPPAPHSNLLDTVILCHAGVNICWRKWKSRVFWILTSRGNGCVHENLMSET